MFRLKNFYGLGILAAVFALSLGLTHFDVLGVEDYIPQAAKVRSVTFESDWTRERKLQSPADIEAMLRLHQGALDKRAESSGAYVKGFDGSWVKYLDSNDHLYEVKMTDNRMVDGDIVTYVSEVELNYTLENGKVVKRRYNIWVDSEPGRISSEYLNNWETLDWFIVMEDGTERSRRELVLETFRSMNIDYMDEEDLPAICKDKTAALELLECMDRDMAEGHMAPHPYYHTGAFQREEKKADSGYVQTESRSVSFHGDKYSWSVDIYPDARHTIKWLSDHDLLIWETLEDKTILW